MKPVPLQQYSCITCPSRKFHCALPTLHGGIMLQPGNCYCLAKKKPKKFKKAELQKEPPLWCPKRKAEVELIAYDFVDENTRNMFAFLYNRCSAMSTDTCQYQIIGRYVVPFTAREFWKAEDKDALLGNIEVPNFGVIAIDDGLKRQYFFKEQDVYIYQPYMRESKKPEGDEH